MTKAPTTTEKSRKQRDNTKTPPKTSITQRLWTDLEAKKLKMMFMSSHCQTDTSIE